MDLQTQCGIGRMQAIEILGCLEFIAGRRQYSPVLMPQSLRAITASPQACQGIKSVFEQLDPRRSIAQLNPILLGEELTMDTVGLLVSAAPLPHAQVNSPLLGEEYEVWSLDILGARRSQYAPRNIIEERQRIRAAMR